MRSPACSRQLNAIFPLLIHQIWPEPFSRALYVTSTLRSHGQNIRQSVCLGSGGMGHLRRNLQLNLLRAEPFCPFWSPPPTMMVIVFLRLRRPAGVVCVRGRQSNINDHFLPPTALCSPPCQVPCMHVQYVLYLDHRCASRHILYLTTI